MEYLVCSLNEPDEESLREFEAEDSLVVSVNGEYQKVMKLDLKSYAILEDDKRLSDKKVALDIEIMDFQYDYGPRLDAMSCIDALFGSGTLEPPRGPLPVSSPYFSRDPYPVVLSKAVFKRQLPRKEPRFARDSTISFSEDHVPCALGGGPDTPLRTTLAHEYGARPAWTKHALRCRLGVGQHQLDALLPTVAYSFSDGPWKNVWIRRGLDPREDPSFCLYQSVEFRTGRHQRLRRSRRRAMFSAAPSATEPTARSYTFSETATASLSNIYQLLDIKCQVVQDLLLNPSGSLSESDGWLPIGSIAFIKTYLRSRAQPADKGANSRLFSENESSSEEEFAVLD